MRDTRPIWPFASPYISGDPLCEKFRPGGSATELVRSKTISLAKPAAATAVKIRKIKRRRRL